MDKRNFYRALLKNPRQIGAVAPSSKILARAVAEQLVASPEEYVVELGPGTGVITHELLSAGLPRNRLIMVEREQGFIDNLKHRFPGTMILKGDARNLKDLLAQHGITEVAAVCSGLPLTSMPDGIRHKIVNAAFEVIKADGLFIQYTYSLMSPVPALHQRDIGIHGRVAKSVWRNLPPARVWCFSTQHATA